MGYRKWTDGDLATAVAGSWTLAEVIRKLGLGSAHSGNYQAMKRHITRMGLDTSHFHSAHQAIPHRKDLEEILIPDSDYAGTSHLKRRLIREGVLEERCNECGLIEWRGRKLSLHLDHIDGDRRNNQRENLRLLCPNCHSQTPTYSKIKRKAKVNKCRCGVVIARRSRTCMTCHAIQKRGKNQKINWPPYNELLAMVRATSCLAVGKQLGVSDKAVKKHLLRHNNWQM